MKKPNSPSPLFAIFRHYSPFFAIGPPPGATEKNLKEVEKMLDLKMYVCQDFNKMFFNVSESVVVTIFNAIFRNVGPSAKNQEYTCTTQFHAYLKSIGESLNR